MPGVRGVANMPLDAIPVMRLLRACGPLDRHVITAVLLPHVLGERSSAAPVTVGFWGEKAPLV